MNPYDLCTFNKMENGKSIIIQFHVNDLKLVYVDEAVLEKYVKLLKKRFKIKCQELIVNCTDVHNYLGLTLNFTHKKKTLCKSDNIRFP